MAGRFASRPALAIRPRSLPWRAGLADSPRAVAGAHPSDRGLELAMCLPARRLCGCSGADLRVHRTQRSIAASLKNAIPLPGLPRVAGHHSRGESCEQLANRTFVEPIDGEADNRQQNRERRSDEDRVRCCRWIQEVSDNLRRRGVQTIEWIAEKPQHGEDAARSGVD